MDKFVPAEKAIFDAVQAVEAMPGDTRLTAAVLRLQDAREYVADYVDKINPVDMILMTPPHGVPSRPPIPVVAPAVQVIFRPVTRWLLIPEVLWRNWGLGVNAVWCNTAKMVGLQVGPFCISFGSLTMMEVFGVSE
jgi:hypothetical protein